MARRKRRSFGEVRHSPKRIRRAIFGPGVMSSKVHEQKVPVVVHVKRDLSVKGTGRYAAVACINRRSRYWRSGSVRTHQRCGYIATGPTPSKAFKNALRKLAAIRSY